MSQMLQFIQYYFSSINQNVNNQQVFQSSTEQFYQNFSHYVVNNLQGHMLHNHPYEYDKDDNLLILQEITLSSCLTIQPVFHLNNEQKIYNLNFNVKINLQNGFQAEEFYYIQPNNFDENFQQFTYILYIIQFYLDNNIINRFFEYIHQLNNEISRYIFQDSVSQQSHNNTASTMNDLEDIQEEDEDDVDKKRFRDFIQKYKYERNQRYEPELIERMEGDKELIFLNFSKFLSDNLIHKNFKIEKLVETLENYTSIFDALNLDKEIYLSAHYFPHFTIRPIIEYSYLKEEIANQPMITIEFFKFEISFFAPFNKEDKFNTTITLIPYKKDKDFEDFLDMYIIFKLDRLSLFDEDVNEPTKSMNLLPFLDALCDELIKVIDMLKNPMLKRNKEANFLNDNRDFNERDLDRFISH